MHHLSAFILALLLFASCGSPHDRTARKKEKGAKTELRYARNISIERTGGYIAVRLLNPWKKNTLLHTYYLVNRNSRAAVPDDGTKITVPLRRSVVFTTAHASLLEMLHAQKAIAGVADLKYMLIPDIPNRTRKGGDIPTLNGSSTCMPMPSCFHPSRTAEAMAVWKRLAYPSSSVPTIWRLPPWDVPNG